MSFMVLFWRRNASSINKFDVGRLQYINLYILVIYMFSVSPCLIYKHLYLSFVSWNHISSFYLFFIRWVYTKNVWCYISKSKSLRQNHGPIIKSQRVCNVTPYSNLIVWNQNQLWFKIQSIWDILIFAMISFKIILDRYISDLLADGKQLKYYIDETFSKSSLRTKFEKG